MRNTVNTELPIDEQDEYDAVYTIGDNILKQFFYGNYSSAIKMMIKDFISQAIATLLIYGSLAFIAKQAYIGLITIGGMVMYFQAFQRGLGFLKGLLGSIAGLYEGNLFLSNLFDFLDIKPSVIDPATPKVFPKKITDGIEFQNVNFSYSTSKSKVLNNINLKINPGEMLALVGENGSGKTTFVKLLCRLYDPASGQITINNTCIKDFKVNDHRGNIGVIFQDYAKYHLTVSDNIGLGDIQHKLDDEAIKKAAQAAGADTLIEELPNKYQTVLGRSFKGGQELSIGQWQKIALARAFIRNAPIVILDEPRACCIRQVQRNRQKQNLGNHLSPVLHRKNGR